MSAMRPPSSIQASLVASCLFLAGAAVAGQEPAIALAPGLLDPAQAATLGLEPPPGLATIPIHRPEASADTCSHGVVLVAFRDQLYAQWQSSRRDEDGTAYLAGNQQGGRGTEQRPGGIAVSGRAGA